MLPLNLNIMASPCRDEKRSSSSTIHEDQHQNQNQNQHEYQHQQERTSNSEDIGFAPITAPFPREDQIHLSKQRSSRDSRASTSRSLERSWSLNDGISLSGNDERVGSGSDEEVVDEFTVTWDDGDVMNPRNMSKFRKWMIVIIVSTGSLCV